MNVIIYCYRVHEGGARREVIKIKRVHSAIHTAQLLCS